MTDIPRLRPKERLKYGAVRLLYPVLSGLGLDHERIAEKLKNRVRHPQWSEIVRNTRDLKPFEPTPDGPRIVLLSMVGNMPLTHFEIPMALALQARGARIEFVLCDGRQRQLCSQTTIDLLERSSKRDACGHCFYNGTRLLRDTPQLNLRTSSELVNAELSAELMARVHELDDDELLQWEYEGARIGLAALQTTMRYFRKGTLEGSAEEIRVIRKMAHSALITLEMCKALHAEGGIDIALFSHGLYESWGPAADYFTGQSIYWATYSEQARKNTYAFSGNASNRLADISRIYDARWAGRELTDAQRTKGIDYLRSRADFSQDVLKLTLGTDFDSREVYQKLNLDPDVPVLTLFGNVPWDAAAVGRDLIFRDFTEWVLETIAFVAERPGELQLLIKAHPSEFIRGTRQTLLGEIAKRYPELPDNVRTMSPTTEINAHSVMRITTAGLVHTSTVGMEMSIAGVPTVVSSWTHYRGYGFTFDPASKEEYFSLIADPGALRARMTDEKRERALKYFYVRCFHSWIEVPVVRLDENRSPYGWYFDSLEALLPGANANLDFVLQQVLAKSDDFLIE